MGNVQSFVVASACSLYFVYVHIYCSHALLHAREFRSDKLPHLSYLYLRCLTRALSRPQGRVTSTPTDQREVAYTVSHSRLEDSVLRTFCSAAGYGWDYPDSEYRDVPLCFPQFLCHTPLLMVLSDDNFPLSPAGLTCVRQTVRTHQPVDELKKGPFVLQVRVLEYRPVEAGVEVDVRLAATSRLQSLVWESVLTLASTHQHNKTTSSTEREREKQELVSEGMKQVMVSAPSGGGLHYTRSFSRSLWMLSVTLAEVEKHKGVGVVTAPVDVSVQFNRPLRAGGKINIEFWEAGTDENLVNFRTLQPQDHLCLMEGAIYRSSLTCSHMLKRKDF